MLPNTHPIRITRDRAGISQITRVWILRDEEVVG